MELGRLYIIRYLSISPCQLKHYYFQEQLKSTVGAINPAYLESNLDIIRLGLQKKGRRGSSLKKSRAFQIFSRQTHVV